MVICPHKIPWDEWCPPLPHRKYALRMSHRGEINEWSAATTFTNFSWLHSLFRPLCTLFIDKEHESRLRALWWRSRVVWILFGWTTEFNMSRENGEYATINLFFLWYILWFWRHFCSKLCLKSRKLVEIWKYL